MNRPAIKAARPFFFVAFPRGETYNPLDPTSHIEEDCMKRNTLYSLIVSALLGLVASLIGCASETEVSNSPPTDLTLVVEKLFVVTSGRIRLIGDATDADGDSLTYSWKATNASGSVGNFDPSATGVSVYWIAPNQPGPVTITMTVSDEIDKSSKTQDVTVCVRFPTPVRESKTIANEGYKYMVTDLMPVRIIEGITLTISPGVTIIIDSEQGGFEAFGNIVAQGSQSQKIRIAGNAVAWDRILMSGESATATLAYTELSGALTGIEADQGATLTLTNCDIYSNTDYGVSISNSSNATIRSCRIWDNGSGVYILNSTVDIRESSIRYGGVNGIELSASEGTPQVVLEDCEIANHYLDCIVLKEKAFPSIHQCSLHSSGEVMDGGEYYAVRLEGGYSGTSPIQAENNFWGLGNTTTEKIEKLIYDAADSPTVAALVSFDPWLDSPPNRLEAIGGLSAKGRVWERSSR